MRYITTGRLPALPPDFLWCYPSHKLTSFSETQDLANKKFPNIKPTTALYSSSLNHGGVIAVLYNTH